MIKYSIIIPFHSNSNLLSACLAGLRKALDFSECEVIIVDNNAAGSQLGSDLRMDKHYRIISRNENLMYPRAINLGAENARGEYLIFCDADTCVTPKFHKALTAGLEVEETGYTAAKLLNIHTGTLLEFGITSSYYNFPHPFSGRPLSFELIQNDHSPLAACAACSSIKRQLFFDVGGFDETLLHSYSDIDLCLRLQDRGYRTVCISNSIAYHCGASTIDSGMGSSLKEDTKGIFAAKHPSIPIKITEYIDKACDYFLVTHRLRGRDYFVFDCSTIGNPELYIDNVTDNLGISVTSQYRQPYSRRDTQQIDLLNFIPYMIRNYKVPIMYFTDCFSAFRDNSLWKACRADFEDIVVDRHANIELLRDI